jgi:hypothetical protein
MKIETKTLRAAVEAAALAVDTKGGARFPAIEINPLNGGGIQLLATDMFRAHLVSIPADKVEGSPVVSALVARELVAALKAAKGAEYVEITSYGDQVTISAAGVSSRLDRYQGGTIPNLASLREGTFTVPESVHFNGSFLADTGKAAELVAGPKGLADITFNGCLDGSVTKASKWTCTNPFTGVAVEVVLMPLKARG